MNERSDELRLTKPQFESLGRLDPSLRLETHLRDRVCERLCNLYGVKIVTILGLNEGEEYSYHKI